jgi:hypothetical protein
LVTQINILQTGVYLFKFTTYICSSTQRSLSCHPSYFGGNLENIGGNLSSNNPIQNPLNMGGKAVERIVIK